MRYRCPACRTSSNGLPVATSALPSVQAMRSAGWASHLEVGFDSGKMMGRSTCRAISRTTSSLNEPNCAAVPMSSVGCTCFTASRSVTVPRESLAQFATASSGCAYSALKGSRSVLPECTSPRLSTRVMARLAFSAESPSPIIAVASTKRT